MRIAQVAPLAESVPPKLYGGTERVVAWLIEDLIALGHDVTLFAARDSSTRATLVPAWPRALRLGRPRSDPMAAQAALLESVAERASDFDVIHCHIDWLHLPLLSRLNVPFLTTCHGHVDLPGFVDVVRRFRMHHSYRSRIISGCLFPRRAGWAPSTTACQKPLNRLICPWTLSRLSRPADGSERP